MSDKWIEVIKHVVKEDGKHCNTKSCSGCPIGTECSSGYHRPALLKQAAEKYLAKKGLENLTDALVENIINTPDEEILKEVEEEYGAPDVLANKMREIIGKAKESKMTTENAIKRLSDSEQELSYSQRLAITKLLKPKEKTCHWTFRFERETHLSYETECNRPFQLLYSDPNKSNYKYCPYCGGKIIRNQ